MNQISDQDWVEEQLAKLEPWRSTAWDQAKEREGDSQEALEQIASEELSDDQWEVVWELFQGGKDLLRKAAREKIRTLPADWGDIGNEVDGWLPSIWLRILATYDASKGAAGDSSFQERDGTKLTTYAYHTSRRQIGSRVSDASQYERRIASALAAVKRRLDRRPSMAEKVEAVRAKIGADVSGETLRKRIADLERGSERRLDAETFQQSSEEGGRRLKDIVPSPALASVDTQKVGRLIAKKTNREELFERLMGEEPTSRSLTNAEARTIYLEREARRAAPERVGWENSTSGWVAARVEDLYDLDVPSEDVAEYARAQGYAEERHPRQLSDQEIESIRAWASELSAEEIAEANDLPTRRVEDVVRGEGRFRHLEAVGVDPEADEAEQDKGADGEARPGNERALSDEEAERVRDRYRQEDLTYRELADDLPICYETLSKVLNGRGPYAHLGPAVEPEHPLPEEKTREIRNAFRDGGTYRGLEEEYGIDSQRLANMLHGRNKYSHLDEVERQDDPRAIPTEPAEDMRSMWREEAPSLAALADRFDTSRTTTRKILRAEGCYSHLGDNIRHIHEEAEADSMTKDELRQRINTLESIIARASEDLPPEDAGEIREHFDELGLTRKQLQGVHETGAVAVECALMGEGYDDFDDLTQQP
ncbi:hypothetical protein GGQ10_002112 [Salinibacter ruber]|uniref:hypothetical protein n=1 Tax=Salinibacter ruber TaxID=146919 RepID=UPI002167E09C|nr:hypothetical protein [Salinibacter ruber]MCS4087286.1 hypothetical protein [Salinibacter ruber]